MPPRAGEPVPLRPRGASRPIFETFRQGTHPPYAIRWFGVTSLFGHARHFAASAIASESVDARDWMRPETPEELLREVAEGLGVPAGRSFAHLAEAMGRPIYIDYVADTGDDRDVASAVARMIFSTYRLEPESTGEPGEEEGGGGTASARDLGRVLPRGDVLLFGGDTAYPVATAEEIQNRLILPFREVLAGRDDGRKRVLLGIPGNHDWYDGLDGFARMFRKSLGDPAAAATEIDEEQRPPRDRKRRGTGLVARQLHLDEVGGLLGLVANGFRSVRAFFRGSSVSRRKRLALPGYVPVQEASYFALPLTAGLELWAVDRQLRRVDFRQRHFFAERRKKLAGKRVLFVSPDPALAYGETNEPGARALAACGLSLERDCVFFLTGDVHHYERREVSSSVHVIAGGGGAFMHGTRIRAPAREAHGAGRSIVAFPDGATSRLLVAQVPLKLMAGKAGFLAHIAFALIASIELGGGLGGRAGVLVTGIVMTIAVTVGLYFVAGHHRRHAKKVAALCIPFGVGLGFLPAAVRLALPRVVPHLAGDTAILIVAAFVGALGFGAFLTTLAVTGLEHQQAFSVLGHPGFKHFVRLCVHPNGRIEAWTIGKSDTLGDGPPELLDAFAWGGDDPA